MSRYEIYLDKEKTFPISGGISGRNYYINYFGYAVLEGGTWYIFGDSKVLANFSTKVIAHDNSKVKATGGAVVVAHDNSFVEADYESKVLAKDNSKVLAHKWSRVIASGSSEVVAHGQSSVIAYDQSRVEQLDESEVERFDEAKLCTGLEGDMRHFGLTQRIIDLTLNIMYPAMALLGCIVLLRTGSAIAFTVFVVGVFGMIADRKNKKGLKNE